MWKFVHVEYSDGDKTTYKKGWTKTTDEFLEHADVDDQVVVSRGYFDVLKNKLEAFDDIKESYRKSESPEQFGFMVADILEKILECEE
ncbi:hypothetical protein CD113_06300 [Staphylococcus simiae]|uniref:Uncharacterized protein n=2 Tax=Staphylococcus simiae TaxID=308354 RepID=G5JH71_9STAP|nr:hypothetical protein SS7213T_04000 [Staphylococcus simiae CCM 7213 = CCUG 51256]PNZ12623.1 hypothetical protein CD113_06300 [Staphylococcus simiae]